MVVGFHFAHPCLTNCLWARHWTPQCFQWPGLHHSWQLLPQLVYECVKMGEERVIFRTFWSSGYTLYHFLCIRFCWSKCMYGKNTQSPYRKDFVKVSQFTPACQMWKKNLPKQLPQTCMIIHIVRADMIYDIYSHIVFCVLCTKCPNELCVILCLVNRCNPISLLSTACFLMLMSLQIFLWTGYG